jgi:Helix-turn-helix domain
MEIENRLYTVMEVAEILRTGPARVREYVRLGILESRRHGRRILILGSSVRRYLGITSQDLTEVASRSESPQA